MTFKLTQFDQEIAERGVTLQAGGLTPVGDFPPGGAKINFQFPPTLSSENKKLNWFKHMHSAIVWENQYMWMGAEPRKATLKATYIVGGPETNGISWTAKNVATELRRYKAYFYSKGAGAFLPVFQLDMYEHAPGSGGGKIPSTWRGINISFNYSDALIAFESGDRPKGVHPLRTDVTLTLELVSNIKYDDGKKLFGYGNLEDKIEQQWY